MDGAEAPLTAECTPGAAGTPASCAELTAPTGTALGCSPYTHTLWGLTLNPCHAQVTRGHHTICLLSCVNHLTSPGLGVV